MSAKKETLPLVLSFLITAGLLGAGFWWLNRDGQLLGQMGGSSSSPTDSSQPQQPDRPSSSPKAVPDASSVPAGLFNYGGSTTWAPIRETVEPWLQSRYPDFNTRYTDPPIGTPGSGSGLEMLLEGQLAFAQSSRPIADEEYQSARQRGFALEAIPVAIDGIAIAVHPDLEIPGLTVEQLQKIYTGEIDNWSQVGGPNLAIAPYSRDPEDGGTVTFFQNNILQGRDFGSNVEHVYSTTPALREVAGDPGGIYYASAPEVVPQCTVKTIPLGRTPDRLVPPYQEPFAPLDQCPGRRNQVNQRAFREGEYPLTRRLFAIVKQDGGADQQAGEAYAELLLSEEGQQKIEEAGFIPIR